MYFTKTPAILKPIAKDFLWDIDTNEKEVFLTFDDGPTPGVTNMVLEQLAGAQALATFFCVGKNVASEKELYDKILRAGHSVGNHTYNHANGWRTANFTYLKEVLQCNQVLNSPLMRPPYGRISLQQAQALKKRYKIVMWDVLSGDWDASISPEKCYKNVMRGVKPGSIIVFHDSLKAKTNVLSSLPMVLETLKGQGYKFSAIPMNTN